MGLTGGKRKNEDHPPDKVVVTLPKRRGGSIACANGHFAVRKFGKWVCTTCDEVIA